MIYKWKDGARIVKGLKAQVVGERLEQLAASTERFTAAVVVEDARNPESPLHPAFEWDDARAAEQYRLDQAANLIRCVVIRVRPEDTEMTRAYINVGRESDRRYESVIRVLSDATLRREMLAAALAELRAFKKKYESLADLAEVFAAAEKIEGAA